jgi:hypothetical protein
MKQLRPGVLHATDRSPSPNPQVLQYQVPLLHEHPSDGGGFVHDAWSSP